MKAPPEKRYESERKQEMNISSCNSCGAYDSDREGCTMPACDKSYACPLESENEMILDANSFDVLKTAVVSKIYCKLYDWFLNHRENGTPFPDVGRLYAADLLEYSRRGGDPLELAATTLCRAYISAMRSDF